MMMYCAKWNAGIKVAGIENMVIYFRVLGAIMELKTGVYKITNTITGMIYIGSAAKSFRVRWNQHKLALSKNQHHNSHLQRAWNLYGEDSFLFEVIETCSVEQCLIREEFHIGSYDFFSLYNLLPHAGSNLGFKHSEETIKKMSISGIARGTNHTDASKEKLRIAHTGLKQSDSHKEAISRANKGIRKPDGFGENLSKIMIGNQRGLGKKCSDEKKAKISASNRNKPLSNEHKESLKISQAKRKIPVVATSITGEILQFEGQIDLANFFGVKPSRVGDAIRTGFRILRKWRITKLTDPTKDDNQP